MTPVTDITKGSLLNKLVRHGSLYFIGNVITRFVQLLLIPLDTRLFTPDDYGTIVTITSTTRVMVIFLGLYLDSAYVRFYYEYKSDPRLLRRYISTLYWFVMGWGLLVVAMALGGVQWIIRPNIPIWPIFVLAFMGPLFTQLSLMSQKYLQQNHRSGLQVSVNLLNLCLNIGVMLLTVGVFKVGMVGKFIGVFCGTGLAFVLGTIILAREGYLGFTFSWPMLIQSLCFSIPLIPNIAAGWIAGFSDRLLLSLYGPVAETGVYNVGYSLGMGFSLFSQSVFMVYGPMVYAWMTEDKEIARKQLERFVPYYFMLMLWLLLAMSLFAREIVMVLTPAEYIGATAVVPVVLFAYFLGSQYQTSVTVLSFEKKMALISSGAIIQAVANLGLNLVLIPRFGKMAAAWTTVVAIGLYAVWMIYWAQKNFSLRVDLRRIGLATLIIGAAVPIHWGLNRLVSASLPLAIAAKLGVLSVVMLLLWFGGGIESADRRRLQERARSIVARYAGRMV